MPQLTREAAEQLQDLGVQVIAVGIGNAVYAEELTTIATRDDLVFRVHTFNALKTIKAMLALTACEGEVVGNSINHS